MGFTGGGIPSAWMSKLAGQAIPPTDGAGGPVSSSLATNTKTEAPKPQSTPPAPKAPKGPFEQKEKLG